MAIYKDKKRNSWYFRVYIEDKNGSKKQKCRSGFKTKSQARDEELKFISSYNKDIEKIIFSDLYNIYIKYKKQNLKLQSYMAMCSRFENHILPYFRDYEIKNITNTIYVDWKQSIDDKGLSYSFKRSLHTCMVGILNYAITFYNLDTNIAVKVGNFSRRSVVKSINFWTYNEFLQFINNIDDIVYYSFFYTLYFTGMRLGECLALNWNDLEDGYLYIHKNMMKVKNEKDNTMITTPKTSSSIRKIKLDNSTIELLNNLKNYYQNFVGFSNDWYIFGGIMPLARTTIGRKKTKYCKISNVKEIKIHDFRHSHATFLLSKGVPITVISKRLGHTNISMTLNVYSHLIPEDEDKSITLINEINEKNIKKREF